jgi:hypothetical protein
MFYQYIVTLKRDNEQQVDRISTGLCFLSVLAFVYEQLAAGQINFLFSLSAIAIASGTILNLLRIRKGLRGIRFRNWLLISAVTWIGMPHLQWLCIFYFILAFLEYQAKYPLELGFTGEGVVINRIIRKKYPWSAFNNILLKDGMLTLDFKDNKIFQRETLEEEEPDAAEDEFNDYCRKHLDKSEFPFAS